MTRIRARIRAAGAQADAAAAAWEGAFLRAIEETDASLDLLAAARRSWLSIGVQKGPTIGAQKGPTWKIALR